jgi:predicted PurR-regulated permease PerM
MKRLIVFVPFFLILVSVNSLAIEVAPRITDREIVERLTRLEEGQKFIIQHFEQRFDVVNQRFDDMNQRITEQHQTMLALYGSLVALIIALFGYIAWDRRTMFRPLKERMEQVELKLERLEVDREKHQEAQQSTDSRSRPRRPYRPGASCDAAPPDGHAARA